MGFWAKCRMDGVDGWVSGWILRLLWLLRFEILPCFGQSRPCQSKLEDSTVQLGGKEMWIISSFCYKINKHPHGLTIWWGRKCVASFDGWWFVFPFSLGLQDGCSVHLRKMQKNVENTALVAKMQFVNWKYTVVGCVNLQSIQHTLNILNLGFISSVEHMFQLKQVGAF